MKFRTYLMLALAAITLSLSLPRITPSTFTTIQFTNDIAGDTETALTAMPKTVDLFVIEGEAFGVPFRTELVYTANTKRQIVAESGAEKSRALIPGFSVKPHDRSEANFRVGNLRE